MYVRCEHTLYETNQMSPIPLRKIPLNESTDSVKIFLNRDSITLQLSGLVCIFTQSKDNITKSKNTDCDIY